MVEIEVRAVTAGREVSSQIVLDRSGEEAVLAAYRAARDRYRDDDNNRLVDLDLITITVGPHYDSAPDAATVDEQKPAA